MRFRTIVPCLATALVFVAGCGSSKKSTSSASTPAAPPATNTATTSTTKTTTTPAKKHKAAAVPSRTYHVKLSGAVESPPGAPKGSGSAVITLRGKSHQVCWTFTAVKGFDKPTFAHIHLGPKGRAGNIVVPLSTGPTFKPKGCVTASAPIISAIAKNPKGYYVNIHSKKYPGGAIRSQL